MSKIAESYETLISVLSIEISYLKSLPPILEIVAHGLTNSGGWSDCRIIPRIYTHPPEDGIQEFDFVGIKPEIGTALVSCKSSEPYFWNLVDIPEWVQGIRVVATKNSHDYLFIAKAAESLPIGFDVATEELVQKESMVVSVWRFTPSI